MQGKREETIKDIILRNSAKIDMNLNYSSFKYNNNEIDINQKYNDIANDNDKIAGTMIINLDTNSLKVYFVNEKNERVIIDCVKKDKIKNICLQYCQQININLKDLSFKYGMIPVNLEETFEQLISNEPFSSNNAHERLGTDVTFVNLNEPNSITNNEIEIRVFKNESFFKRHKKLIIIVSSIILIIIISLIIFFALRKQPEDENDDNNNDDDDEKSDIPSTIIYTQKIRVICKEGYYNPDDDITMEDCKKCSLEGCQKCNGTYEYNECTDCGNLISVYNNSKIIKCNNTCETGKDEKCLTCYEDKIQCKSCNIGYKLNNGKCKPDFLIKAIYNVTKNDTTTILFHSGDYSYLTKMIIEDKEITPSYGSHFYKFKNEGINTVYFKFRKCNSYSSKTSFFSGIEKLISVAFSDFNEYLPDIALRFLFSNSINLLEVDLSKMNLAYSYQMVSMFNGCVKLKYINLNFKTYKASLDLQEMFLNCKSLKSIDLSNLDVSQVRYFGNMFNGCTSLEEVNLKSFKLDSTNTNINKMFYNCISLKSVDLSSFSPVYLVQMNSIFYNCNSLTSINLKDFDTSQITNMELLFYNCTSLKYIDLSDFTTEHVTNMDSMFEYCTFLTSINFGNYFNTQKVTRMNSMFRNCHSLERIDFPSNFVVKLSNLTSFFSNCYSLTSINLNNFDISKTTNFKSMFINCYSLTSIDISNFYFNTGVTIDYMFAGCYSLKSINFFSTNNIRANHYGIFFDCPNLIFANISFVNLSYSSNYIFNKNISKNGTLILNRKYYDSSLKQLKNFTYYNWTLLFL